MKATFEINGEQLKATRKNTILFAHYRQPEFDHIVLRKEEAGMVLAHYIFRPNVPNFDEVQQAMINAEYPVMAQRDATPATIEKFEGQFALPVNTFPEEWCQ